MRAEFIDLQTHVFNTCRYLKLYHITLRKPELEVIEIVILPWLHILAKSKYSKSSYPLFYCKFSWLKSWTEVGISYYIQLIITATKR
jgi:hypothetical protein